ncbi:MAG: hypothetical protein ACJ76H_16675 [Bacteriovoracaceae bacterium]
MKWALVLSLLLNGVLGWRLLNQKEVVREEIVEKIVVKKAEPEIIEKKVIVEVPKEKAPLEGTVVHQTEFDERDMNDSVEQVSHDREEYLHNQLQLTPEELKEIEAVKQKYVQRFMTAIPHKKGIITLDDRKKLLVLEEQRDAEFARIMGQKKWDSFTKYRDNYNQKVYKKGIKEKGIIVPMEI